MQLMKSISGYLSYRSSYTGKKKDIHTIMFIVFLFIIAKCENDLKCPSLNNLNSFVIVPSLSCVQLFETPWNAAQRASLTFTISQSLLKLTLTESVMSSNHLILCHLCQIFLGTETEHENDLLRSSMISWEKKP